MKQTPQPHHEWLKLQNFTVFRDAEFTFNPGINVFIGENGTGKTHLLKLLYGVQKATLDDDNERQHSFATHIAMVFQHNLDELRAMPIQGGTKVTARWGSRDWGFSIADHKHAPTWSTAMPETMSQPVFIPATDMLGHTRRFMSTFDAYRIDFDQTYRDVVGWLLSPERRNIDNKDAIIHKLREVMGGEVREKDERFFFDTPNGSFPATLVAEGIRKVGTLYTLVKNGCLEQGATLYWDEPDVNVNPILLRPVAEALLALSGFGVQIFVATHSYELLKEFDLQARRGTVRYFSLERTEGGSVVHSTDEYDAITPNRIDDEFASLYDRELNRATGRSRK